MSDRHCSYECTVDSILDYIEQELNNKKTPRKATVKKWLEQFGQEGIHQRIDDHVSYWKPRVIKNCDNGRYLFSQFRDREFDRLYQALSKVFNFSKSELEIVYQQIVKQFEQDGYPYPQYPLKREYFCPEDVNFQQRYNDAFIIAMDIPSILELDNGVVNKPTLVLIGQDPKRDSKNPIQQVKDIAVGTPYGLHQKGCREDYHITQKYFKMIKVLLDNGYRVYLTDIYKIWVSKSEPKRGKVNLKKKDKDRFISILREELAIFEPIGLITWGKPPENTIKSLKLNINHISYPHPSGANRKDWKPLIGKSKSANDENILEYWERDILEYLSKLNQ